MKLLFRGVPETGSFADGSLSANREDAEAVQAWERRLARFQASTLADWQWLARRLARAVENEWSQETTAPLVLFALG